MIEEKILHEFRLAHPRLFELNPDVSVYEIIESTEEGWEQMEKPVYRIDVKHPFLFDVRLIPEEFNGISVQNVWVGEFPDEFPSDDEEIPLEVWYAPERYKQYVSRNLDFIAETLNHPNISEEEALDALIGDFQKHIEWCEELKTRRQGMKM